MDQKLKKRFQVRISPICYRRKVRKDYGRMIFSEIKNLHFEKNEYDDEILHQIEEL